MKQFMSISALFLSAACLCVHSPSFASSGPNDVQQGVEKMATGTGKVLKGAGDASAGVIKTTGSGLEKIGQSLKNGWDKMTNTLSGKSSNAKSNSKYKTKRNPSGSDPIVTPILPGNSSAQMSMPTNPNTGIRNGGVRSQMKNSNNAAPQSGVNTGSGSAADPAVTGTDAGGTTGGSTAPAAGGSNTPAPVGGAAAF